MTLTPENKVDALADAFFGLCGLLHERGVLPADVVAKRLRGAVYARAIQDDAGRARALDALAHLLDEVARGIHKPHSSPR